MNDFRNIENAPPLYYEAVADMDSEALSMAHDSALGRRNWLPTASEADIAPDLSFATHLATHHQQMHKSLACQSHSHQPQQHHPSLLCQGPASTSSPLVVRPDCFQVARAGPTTGEDLGTIRQEPGDMAQTLSPMLTEAAVRRAMSDDLSLSGEGYETGEAASEEQEEEFDGDEDEEDGDDDVGMEQDEVGYEEDEIGDPLGSPRTTTSSGLSADSRISTTDRRQPGLKKSAKSSLQKRLRTQSSLSATGFLADSKEAAPAVSNADASPLASRFLADKLGYAAEAETRGVMAISSSIVSEDYVDPDTVSLFDELDRWPRRDVLGASSVLVTSVNVSNMDDIGSNIPVSTATVDELPSSGSKVGTLVPMPGLGFSGTLTSSTCVQRDSKWAQVLCRRVGE
ncbi:unnamed protein product [Protopolystoma xenopodis]|uniref:Uncharacterized protein n=1 Tax=Protopolystoma xenopodis TaxID=117903 RepID=A0A3S5BWW6_9PLAT|nr:unnamed protein product [Protopolystoma xenopodis]